MKRKPLAAIFLFSLLLSSCLGTAMDITLNQNGSGTIDLEYRVSGGLDSLGRLDGNERWNTIPVGRSDFERTLERLPDLRLLSHSSKDDGKDLVVHAKIEFKTINGLLAFLDASGRRASFSGDARSGRLVLALSEGAEPGSPGLSELIAAVSESYSIKMSMSFPNEGTLALSDKRGMPLTAGTELTGRGKKVSFSVPLYEVLSSASGINAEFRW